MRFDATLGQLAELLEQAGPFLETLEELLRMSPPDAVFLEFPPLARSTLGHPLELALVDAPTLATLPPEPRTFDSPFRGAGARAEVATFENLGGDALLVAPTPPPEGDDPWPYAHLAAFVRGAPPERRRAFWSSAGRAIRARGLERPLWVSTSGLGVAWLHLRLDDRPKYYQHAPYRRSPDA